MTPGDVLDGRYTLERVAGSGGGGVVYRARDGRTGTPVAIKVVHADPAFDARFEREAATLAALRHPNVVAELGHGAADGERWIVLEWLEGEDLGTRLARGELGIDDSLAVARQVAAALAAAHALGVVHRDVKPSNVFLVGGRIDQVKLLDFGLARRAGLASLTATGVLVGTPIYMAPEQARGARELDARVDVYALGALLYRLIAGAPPFAGDTLEEVVARVLGETPRRLARLRPGLPRGLDDLVARLLAKDPARRPADGAAVLAALADLDHVPPEPSVDDPVLGATLDARPAPASSIAVLSFRDLSSAGDQGYLCDGIAEELIDALGHVDGLRVAARSSSFRFKGNATDAREVGQRLGVDAVLEGGVRRAGERLRVTVQLVDVATGYQRWSRRFDGKLDDVFAVQDEIAAGVVVALRGMLSKREQDAMRRHGTHAEAYALFLRGRQLFHDVSRGSYATAQDLFRRALEIDPGYAPAYAGLAQMHSRFYEWSEGDAATLEAADRASQKALELAPDLAESHIARGHYLKVIRRYADASREFRAAIAIHPNSYDAHVLWARTCFQAGDGEQAAELFRTASDLDRDAVEAAGLWAQTLRAIGRAEEARAAGKESIRRADRRLALAPDDAYTLSLICTTLHHDGQHARAFAAADRALALSPEDPAVWYNIACLYASAGQADLAFFYLEKTFGGGHLRSEWLDKDPDLEPLRPDPRFQALLVRVR